jgi:hypothetical protein
MKTDYIDIPEKVVNEVERYHYDYQSYKDVIASCLEMHQFDSDDSFLENKVFKGYQKQAAESFAGYNLAKEQINQYIPTDYEGKAYNWNLNFATNQLEITVA